MASPQTMISYRGPVAQAGAMSTSTPSSNPKKKRIYEYDRGFCYIPKGDWQKALEKRPGSGIHFYVSSMGQALIIPAGYEYPHVTLDIQETRFLVKDELVAVRVSQAHYSPASRSRRVAFTLEGLNIVYPEGVTPEIQRRIQHYFASTHFPFQQPLVLIKESPTVDITERTAKGESGEEESTEQPTSFTSVSMGEPSDLAQQDKSPQTHKASKLLETSQRKIQASKKRQHKSQSKQQAAPIVVAVSPVIDPHQAWCEDLDVNSHLQAIDTLDLGSAGERALSFAVIYWKLLSSNRLKLENKYAEKVLQRNKLVMDALCDSADLTAKASKVTGQTKGMYRKAASKKAEKEIGAARKVGTRTGESSYRQQVLDFDIDKLLPTDFNSDNLRPDSSDPDKFKGYQIAMLLAFKKYILQCREFRSQEFYIRAYYLAIHIKNLCIYLAPNLEVPMLVLIEYVDDIRTTLNAVVKKIEPGSYSPSEKLIKLHDNIEEIQEWNNIGIGRFRGYSELLGDLAEGMAKLNRKQWMVVARELVIPLANIKDLKPKNSDHWSDFSRSLKTMLAIVNDMHNPEQGTSTDTSQAKAKMH